MRTIPYLIAALFVLCLTPPPEVRASISTNAGLWYFESTNEEWAVASVSPDYGDQAYYTLWDEVSISDGVNGNYASAICWEEYFCSYAQAEASLPYDPNAEYELWSNPTATVIPQEGGTWQDYYGYSYYYDAEEPFTYPMSFQFTGGPAQQTFPYIPLGNIFAIASGGTMHGPPHHIRATDDETTLEGNCEPWRKWKYKVVDDNGLNAGRVHVKEQFPGAEYTSCGSHGEVHPSPCSINYWHLDGKVWDNVHPGGCTDEGHCGFTFNVEKWWCPGKGAPSVKLATILYEVYADGILLNHSTNLTTASWHGYIFP
jgi:hypothetical protein